MIGIYKITNPKGKVYIGQSRNIYKRFKQYQNLKSSSAQVKLHYSFLKYGIENHNFEIIQECDVTQLNITERYYQEAYNAVYNGLNCRFTEEKESSDVVYSGRKIINPEDKLTLVRLWVKKSTINTLGEDNIKQNCAKTIETMLNN